MSKKLPPGHGENAHKDKMGKVMHEWKHGTLHSGTGKKGKKGPVVKSREQAIAIGISESRHAEQLVAMGYSEEAARAVADFIESQKAADEVAQNSLEGDIDAKPGKQRGAQGKPKQDPQGSIATFPTVPHSEGPMVKARKGSCPTSTRAVGGGFCKNPEPGKRQYFEIEKGKSCPPGSKTAGKGRCRVDFVEAPNALPSPGTMTPTATSSAVKSIQDTPCEPKKKDSGEPKQERATPTQPVSPTEPTKPADPQQQQVKDAAKKKAEQCSKQQGN